MSSNGLPANVQSVITQVNTRDNDGTITAELMDTCAQCHASLARRPSTFKQRMTRFWNRLRCVREPQTAPVHQDQMVVVRVRRTHPSTSFVHAHALVDLLQTPTEKSLLGEPSAELRNRKCLVLDMDETLIHSSFKVRFAHAHHMFMMTDIACFDFSFF